MAEHHPLQYWLESINLPQYYLNFVEHGIITQEQCVHLDEETLTDIGITMSGHHRRILAHLPTVESGIWLVDARPNLPPKQKSVRESYLFKDGLPNISDSSNIYGNVPDILAGKVDTNISDTVSFKTLSPGDTETEESKVSPKPVPRPRSRSKTQSVQSPTTPNNGMPKPAPRPVPAPRKLTQTNKTTTNSTSSETISSGAQVNSTSEITDAEYLYSTPDKAKTTDQPNETSPELYFPSGMNSTPDESLTDRLNAFDSNVKQYSYSESNTNIMTDMRSSRHLALSLEGVCVDETQTETNSEEEAGDIYENVAEKHDRHNKQSSLSGKSHDISQGSTSAVKHDHNYINVDIDAVTKSLEEYSISKKAQVPNTLLDHNMAETGNVSVRLKPEQCPAQTVAESPNRDDIYEPIWSETKNSNSGGKPNVRSSNLMQFSPFVDKTGARAPGIQGNRMSTFGKERPATVFDMPPPEFPPPPLPSDSTVNPLTYGSGNSEDLLKDFDPLSMLSQVPTIPPRPENYVAPKFKIYQNIAFHDTGGSTTLPGTDVNMEPDDMDIPHSISYQDGASDPFKQVDPFGDFTPDDSDFSTESFPPVSCHTEANKNNNTFVNAFTGSSFTSRQSDVYDVAKDVTEDFDPFGLNTKDRLPSLARSESSNSAGSAYKLSEVPPAPKWPHTIPEGNWFQSSSTDSMYSLAEQIHTDNSSNESLDDILNPSPSPGPNEQGEAMSPVEILPVSNLPSTRRKKERSGYLYKQGGVRNNRGWRKRWVIFDGKTLRYYSNSKDQVSKRIVPLSCMTNIEMDIRGRSRKGSFVLNGKKPNNARQFKFLLHCTNRTFLFATDNLDDCKLWSNTLMEAILTYTKPDTELPGGDMADPDIADWIKINKNRVKFYVALKKHKLCYYQNMDDFKMASPLHEIDMKLSAVKELDRTRLQLSTHYSVFILHFETSSDASNWKIAIEEAITDALGDNTILDQVKENAANSVCGDCGANDPHWASMNLGMVLCLRCAGIHRGFDHKLSKIRSLRMDTRIWNSSLIELFKVLGNERANQFWLKRLPAGSAINVDTPILERKQFIHNKYKDQMYSDKHPYVGDRIRLNEALLSAAQTDDVMITYQVLMSGAEVLYCKVDQPQTTGFELAKLAHQRLQMEFLLQNGGDRSRNFLPGSDEEASLTAKMRSEVQLQGYLHKTGSNMKDFLKRHCVLEHGHLSYYVNEEARVEKDRIDNETILCIQAVSHERHPACFEISSKKNNRIYLFEAASEEERLQWISSIAQVFCPVSKMEMMKHLDFLLAGYTYLKTGFNMEWQRSWYVLEKRKLIFIDKEEVERDFDSIDLRKVTSITKITQSMESCQSCLEHGHVFVVKAGDRMLYFQTDLIRDTDRMFSAIEQAAKRGGDMLEDQVLTNDDIPVIVFTCVNFIQQHGARIDGIYRQSEQETKIKNLLLRFQEDARSVVLKIDEDPVHAVSNVLKRFLRNLKDPLLTKQFYPRWLQTASESDHNTKLQWYKYLLQQLPRINYLTLKFFVTHLHKVSKYETENRMSIENLAISLGSSLMQSYSDADAMKGIGAKNALEMRVLTDIITYHSWLFDVAETPDVIGERLEMAQRKLEILQNQEAHVVNDLMISVHYLSPAGNAETIKINQESTATYVVSCLTGRLKLSTGNWSLYEIVKKEIERPLHGDIKLWPLIHEWQNWASDYRSAACLCLRSSELKDKIEQAFDPSRSLFGEMKYSGEKKRFDKKTFEFARAKLSYYKDSRSLNHPSSSWNIEDLSVYRGCDPKRPPPTRYCFTFLPKGDKIGEKEMFGKTVCCTSEQDLYAWMGAMYKAQLILACKETWINKMQRVCRRDGHGFNIGACAMTGQTGFLEEWHRQQNKYNVKTSLTCRK